MNEEGSIKILPQNSIIQKSKPSGLQNLAPLPDIGQLKQGPYTNMQISSPRKS